MLEAATGDKLSVGPPYFNTAAGPLTLALVAIMAAGPLLRWRRDKLKALVLRLIVPLVLTAAALAGIYMLAPGIRLLPLLGLTLAIGVGAASLAPLWKRNLRRTPLFVWGMAVSHFGIAVSLAGMACEAAFSKELLVAARPGETVRVGPWAIRFDTIDPIVGPNWTAIEGKLTASRGGSAFVLRPQARMFLSPPTETSEAAIATRLDGQLYTVIGKEEVGWR
jgi:cytochrome c-type biogenesis protein CcmF